MTNGLRLNLHDFISSSRVNGPGTRAVVYVQGCPFRCPGCWNQEALEFGIGKDIAVAEVFAEIMAARSEIDGVTFLGGEPFAQAKALAELGELCQKEGLTVLTYTGYTLEALQSGKAPKGASALLSVTDTLIDGPFIARQRSDGLVWRGSANQRIIHLTNRMIDLFETHAKDPGFEFHVRESGMVFTTDQFLPDMGKLSFELRSMGIELDGAL